MMQGSFAPMVLYRLTQGVVYETLQISFFGILRSLVLLNKSYVLTYGLIHQWGINPSLKIQ